MASSNGLHGRVIVDVVRTRSGALLTAGIEDRVQPSTDDGLAWDAAAGCAGNATRVCRLLGATQLPDPSPASPSAPSGGRVYAATTRGVHVSTDSGKQFTPWSDHLPVLALDAWADCVYAPVAGGRVWRRTL